MNDRTPVSVRAVLNKPGKYAFQEVDKCFYFEVDGESQVHQLKPDTLERDGVLSKSGWAPSSFFGNVVPL